MELPFRVYLLIAQSLTFSQLLARLPYTFGMDESAMGPCKTVDGGITRVFVLLGKRWTGLIVAVLMERPVHFADLRRAIPGISERMLSDRLSELGAAGLVVREVDAGPPLRVAYRLTEAGAALGPALAELRDWAERYLPDGQHGACRGAEAAAPGK
ncbi:DNA-binding HxlR family transcriptional regulator [Streptomyces sp. B4I13]|nr:DNA-binding HxlR family transcriptional regulator [Streptomyces achromogenes]MDQ0963862.1 DNA-binding HxlR family transcriptional regulator [Streptomyces sp. B4I13]